MDSKEEDSSGAYGDDGDAEPMADDGGGAPSGGSAPVPVQVDALSSMNGVTYSLEPSISVATSRTMKEYLCSNDAHVLGVDPIILSVTSGAAYVDLQNSYLSLDVNFEGMGGEDFRNVRMSAGSSWANMFDGFKVTHATGVEIDRMQSGLGVWRSICQFYDNPDAWRKTVGEGVLGLTGTVQDSRSGSLVCSEHEVKYQSAPKKGQVETPNGRTWDAGNSKQHVVIPLAELMEWCDKDELAPPFLMSGLRLDLHTLSKEAFFQRPDDIKLYNEEGKYQYSDYTQGDNGEAVPNGRMFTAHDKNPWPVGSRVILDNIRLNLCAYTLTDSMTRHVSEVSAAQGLEWDWTAIAHTTTLNNEEVFTLPINQALSRANCLIVKARLNAHLNSVSENQFASLPWLPATARDECFRSQFMARETVEVKDAEEWPNRLLDGACVGLQARVGAMYIPAQPIRGGLRDFYHSALQTWSAFRRTDNAVGPTITEYAGEVLHAGPQYSHIASYPVGVGPIPYVPTKTVAFIPHADVQSETTAGFFHAVTTAAKAIYAIPLETSPQLKQSGLAISAQRTAELNFEFKTLEKSSGSLRRYDLFVPHTKVATLFLGDVCVVRN